jgi:hypothetical protein
VLTNLWGWLYRQLGIEPWGQVLIIGLVLFVGLSFSFAWLFNNRLTTIEANLNDLPQRISDQTDAKLEHLRADLIKEFILKAKQFTTEGNFKDAVAALRAGTILTQISTNIRASAEPDSLGRETTRSDARSIAPLLFCAPEGGVSSDN